VLGGHFPWGRERDRARALVDIPAAGDCGKPVVIILPVGGEEVEMAEAERAAGGDRYREMGILALPTLTG
jgi:hypothetical protein